MQNDVHCSASTRHAIAWLGIGLVAAVPLATEAQVVPASAARLTIERIPASPSLTGTAPALLRWSPDGRVLAFLWNDEARPERNIWMVHASGTAPTRLTTFGRAERQPEDTRVPGIHANRTVSSVAELAWQPDGRAIVFLHGGDVHMVDPNGTDQRQLTRTGGTKSALQVSPDGRFISWLQDGDLWLLNQQSGDIVQATKVGLPGPGSVPLGTYNRPDVEFGNDVWGGGIPPYRWSPDSRFLALHYVNRRNVRKVMFPYYLGEETTANVLRRGYPGDHDEIRTIAFYSVERAEVRMLDFPDQGWWHINGFSWSPDGRLLIDRVSDTQQDRWLHVASPRDGEMTTVWHGHRESRVYSSVEATWSADGSNILMVGDLDDRYRLYRVAPGKGQPTAVTPGTFDVSDVTVAGTGPARAVFYVSNEKSPYERHVYRIAERGGPATPITTMPGTHQPAVSPDGKTVALVSSNDLTPPELYLADAQGGRPERRMTASPPAEFSRYRWVQPRYVTFKSRIDGFTLHARILEPPNIDKTRRYPIVFGPVYSNTVRNRWAGNTATLQQFLAIEKQFIVVQVDVRGSTGYGREFREKFLMDYGGHDLDDLQSALEYLKTVPYADTDRAGIWGSSYGGLLTTYMLFKKPGLFKAGVAAAAAVDPRFFGTDDVAITRLPNTHPEAYRRGAASHYAKNLQDPLLFIHGMQDDVVPFKTIVDLMEQLMLLGKDFDLAIAPAATHGWAQREHYAVFMYRKLVQHFDRHLGGIRPAVPRSTSISGQR
jgi:dipeptidyl-peptidase-4